AMPNSITLNRDVTIGGTTGLEFAGPLAMTQASHTITVTNTANTVLSGVVSGSSSLLKAGAGSLTLANASNTYSGATTVSAGTLRVNNTTGSGTGTGNVTVASTATLGGGGSIAGNVIVNSGAHVAPGNSIGTITVAGLTLNTGSNLDVEVGAPSSSDEVIVTTPSTGLTLSGGTVNITNAGGLAPGPYV